MPFELVHFIGSSVIRNPYNFFFLVSFSVLNSLGTIRWKLSFDLHSISELTTAKESIATHAKWTREMGICVCVNVEGESHLNYGPHFTLCLTVLLLLLLLLVLLLMLLFQQANQCWLAPQFLAEVKSKGKKAKRNNNKMDDKWNMELPATKTFSHSRVCWKRKKWFLLSLLFHRRRFHVSHKSEETIKME